MKNMTAVESVDKSKDLVKTRELISNIKKHVLTEERWVLRSETQHVGAAVQTTEEQAVVVTLEDGQTKYLIRRIPNQQKEGIIDVTVTYYTSRMGPSWVCVGEKQVQGVKLGDYFNEDDEIPETEANVRGENEDQKDSSDVSLVRSDDKGEPAEGHTTQFEDQRDSSDGPNDPEDTTSKM